MKKILLVLLFLGVVLYADDNATDFSKFDNVVTSASSSAQKTMGIFGRWFIGLLPLFGLSVGIFGGMKYLRVRSNGQEENFAKELGFAGGGAFIGLIVSVVFISVIGTGLMGDSSQSFNVLYDFWKQVFGVATTGNSN